MVFEDLVMVIGQLGFPIGVALFLLYDKVIMEPKRQDRFITAIGATTLSLSLVGAKMDVVDGKVDEVKDILRDLSIKRV
jgi:hypothetical protein